MRCKFIKTRLISSKADEMAKKVTNGKPNRSAEKKNSKLSKRQKEEAELEKLQERVDQYDPKSDEQHVSQFADLPISSQTLQGLKESSFVTLTDIQKKSIPMALKREDIMATAKTGSGKTLAFLVPTIESLIRNKITEYDGLAALIVSPTRELAIQIFEVLTKIGKYNLFSAGLVTGGKDIKYEKERISRMNILVGTPGRISQHLNEAVGLETSNLQVLVLDEADRCLDMGFKKQIDSIVSHLPPDRQTLLYSATQTQNVKDLARLSLTNPTRIGVSSDEEISETPDSLEQFYIKINLDEKLDTLWSFIKSHLKSKILVFFSSSKQVQYAHETFKTLQPGISLLKLYGRHKQTSRLETTVKFSQAQYACLFATDIVARGLDFPAIDWVIQLDCPEDVATYVHRVGRAARFGRQGKSLMMLLPSEEEAMIQRMKANNIDVKLMNIKQKSKKSIKPQLQSLCFKSPQIKNLGQRAFISYFRSVYLQKSKDVFDVEKLPADRFAASLGLPGAPKVKIKGGNGNKEKKNVSRKMMELEKTDEDGEELESKDNKVRTKYDRMFERQNQTVLSENYLGLIGEKAKSSGGDDPVDNEEEDFMTVKRQDHTLVEEDLPDLSVPVSRRQAKKALSKKASLASKGNPNKLVFDDEGVAHPIYELEDEADFKLQGDTQSQIKEFVDREQEYMTTADQADKVTQREKRQEKKRKRKEQLKSLHEGVSDDEERAQVTLGPGYDLDRDMEEHSSDEEVDHQSKKPKWFQKDVDSSNKDNKIIEIEEPQTIEDLESLTEKLLHN